MSAPGAKWAGLDDERDTLIATLTAENERLRGQVQYPDDPARSIAAMLSRMSPEDRQAFNFCVKAVRGQAEARVAALEEALRKHHHPHQHDYVRDEKCPTSEKWS